MLKSNLLSYANAIGLRSRVSARDGGVNAIRSDIEDTKAGVAPGIWAKSLALISIKRSRAAALNSRFAGMPSFWVAQRAPVERNRRAFQDWPVCFRAVCPCLFSGEPFRGRGITRGKITWRESGSNWPQLRSRLRGLKSPIRRLVASVQRPGVKLSCPATNMERSSVKMQGPAANLLRSVVNMQCPNVKMRGLAANLFRSVANMQRPNVNMQGLAANLFRSDVNMQGLAANLFRSVANTQRPNVNMQGLAANLFRSAANMQGLAANLFRSVANMQRPAVNLRRSRINLFCLAATLFSLAVN